MKMHALVTLSPREQALARHQLNRKRGSLREIDESMNRLPFSWSQKPLLINLGTLHHQQLGAMTTPHCSGNSLSNGLVIFLF